MCCAGCWLPFLSRPAPCSEFLCRGCIFVDCALSGVEIRARLSGPFFLGTWRSLVASAPRNYLTCSQLSLKSEDGPGLTVLTICLLHVHSLLVKNRNPFHALFPFIERIFHPPHHRPATPASVYAQRSTS